MNYNIEYEKFAQEIYQGLINAQGIETIVVQHNVKLLGKSGQEHQIDVYWEYEIAGIKHKVAIECKNYNNAVPIGKVRDFYGVLSDLNNVAGIMVTKVGYQEGAKKYADTYGISLKELRTPNDQDWDGRIKSIGIQLKIVMANIKSRLPLLDEEWIKANVKFPEDGPKTYILQGRTDEIIIYNENGEPITNFYELDNQLSCLSQSETEGLKHTYAFDNAYMDFTTLGRVKIKGVQYSYDIVGEDMERIIIDAQETTKAILKDALSGEIKFFNKNGDIK